MEHHTELLRELEEHFGYTSFKPGQEEVLTHLFNGRSVLGILPTGVGKSLCYQLYGYAGPGRVLVVSPLISLMQDQVENLRLMGEKGVVALVSELEPADRRRILDGLDACRFVFVSPEMLNARDVAGALQRWQPALFVVDEAHCISTWGPDFRPDYLSLGRAVQRLGGPLVLALTATATRKVEEDICRTLFPLHQPEIVRCPVDRQNIYLAVDKVEDEAQKNGRLIELLTGLKGPALVYFSSKRKADGLSRFIRERTGLRTAPYHAGMPFDERYSVLQQFLHDELDVVCATSAFGMGINKPDIRCVIHYHLPSDLENYVQEFGRASRDGRRGAAILLYQESDVRLQEYLIENALPTAQDVDFYMKSPAVMRRRLKQDDRFVLIDRYLRSGLGAGEMQSLVTRRLAERRRALSSMRDYAETKGCLRQFISGYFGDFPPAGQEFCCSRCSGEPDFAGMGLAAGKREEKKTSAPGYKEIIRNLFA